MDFFGKLSSLEDHQQTPKLVLPTSDIEAKLEVIVDEDSEFQKLCQTTVVAAQSVVCQQQQNPPAPQVRVPKKYVKAKVPSSALKPCYYCGERFPTKNDLKTHKKINHCDTEGNLLPPKCSLCDTPFEVHDELRRHFENVHMQGVFYPCPECGIMFSWKGLSAHMTISHGAKEAKTFRCEICSFTTHTKAQ